MKNSLMSLVEANDAKLREESEEKRIAAAKEKKAEGKDGKKKGAAKASEEIARREISEFAIGDTVDVHLRILEGNKERVQVFQGMVIGRRGTGANEMFTVRRIVQGEGVERIFPLISPKVAKIEVKRTGVVRRAKLYYMRDRVGKSTRLRERVEADTETTAGESGGNAAKAKATRGKGKSSATATE